MNKAAFSFLSIAAGAPRARALVKTLTVLLQQSFPLLTHWSGALGLCLAATLTCIATSVHAQTSSPPAVAWEIQVVRDGQYVDGFRQTTTVGQTYTDTHHFPAALPAGCTVPLELSRTVTVAPLYVDSAGNATLAIETQQTFNETPSTSCAPVPPRHIIASHPGLTAQPKQWFNWSIIDRHPRLVYRIRAHLVQD